MYNVLLITMQALHNNQNATTQAPSYAPVEDLQPSHYEYEPFDAEKTLKTSPKQKTSSAGEFEMPVMDTYDLHASASVQNPKPKISDIMNSEKTYKLMEKSMHLANGLNIFTSGVTAIGSAMTKNDNFNALLQKLASFGAKASMGVNSLFNILNGHKKKDLANVIGYTGELAVAVLAPYKLLGLLRGATFSTYQTSNILANVKPMTESKTYGDYVSQVKERLPILMKKIFTPKSYLNLKENAGFITGGWGSILSYTGVLGWAATGSTKFGGWVKGIGEVLVDSYQVLTKEHWQRKKQFYIGSGISFVIGSLCEIVSKQRNNDPVTMALYFFGSGIGRTLYTISNILGEDKYGINGPENTNKSAPKTNIFEILNFNKAQASAT